MNSTVSKIQSQSDYKNQREFESKILSSNIQELDDYVSWGAAKANKNKQKGLILGAERGDVEIFKLLLKSTRNCYGYRSKKIDFVPIFKKAIEFDRIELIKYLLKNTKDICFNFYLNRESVVDEGLDDNLRKGFCTLEMIKTLLNKEYRVSKSFIKNESQKLIMDFLIKENDVEFFDYLYEDFTKYNFMYSESLTKKLLKEKKIDFLHVVKDKLDQDYKLVSFFKDCAKEGMYDVFLGFKKNKAGITLKAVEEHTDMLTISLESDAYYIFKKYFNRKSTTQEMKEIAFKNLTHLKKEKTLKKILSLYENDKDFNINNVKNDVMYILTVTQNETLIDFILEHSNEEKFEDNLTRLTINRKSENLFHKYIADKRIIKENKELESINCCLACGKYDLLIKLLKTEDCIEHLSENKLMELLNEKRYEELLIFINNIDIENKAPMVYIRYALVKNDMNLLESFLTKNSYLNVINGVFLNELFLEKRYNELKLFMKYINFNKFPEVLKNINFSKFYKINDF